MKNFFRNWLGLNEDMKAVANDVNILVERTEQQALRLFEVFHTLPFASGAMMLTAADAARMTLPEGVLPNELPALLTGVIANARQGNSYFEVDGELRLEVRDALLRRGFKVEDQEGSGGKATFIMWT
jgi:hypothetical protein